MPPLWLQWPDGPATTLTVSVEVTSPACYWTDWLSGDDTLSYGVLATASTEDGSLVGQYPGFVTVIRARAEDTLDVAEPPATAAAGPAIAYVSLVTEVARADVAMLGMPAAAAAVEMEQARAGDLSELQPRWGVAVDVDGRRLGGSLRLQGERDSGCFDTDPLTQDTCLSRLSAKLLDATIEPK